MTENTKSAEAEDEDWAVFPFDETEDERRWDKLIEETDELIRKTESTEAIYGKILLDEDLPPAQAKERRALTDDEELSELEPF